METQSPSSSAPPVLLVGTDFSDPAAAALEWAVELARQQGARLELVHAVSVPPAIPGYVPAADLNFSVDVERAARARLEQAAAALGAQGTEVSIYLAVGVPSRVILDRAEEIGAAGVVMGTRGLTGAQHLLLGSTTERVVHAARCPVLAVHPEDRGQHRPIRSILVPTDFSADAELAIATAHRLLAPLGQDARLILIHAFNLPVEYTAYGPIPTSLNFLKDTGLEAERRLFETAQRLEREGLTVETVAREGDPAHVIAAEAQARGADLIAMGTHGHSGLHHLLLGSTAERVVQHARCPVMTIRRPKD